MAKIVTEYVLTQVHPIQSVMELVLLISPSSQSCSPKSSDAPHELCKFSTPTSECLLSKVSYLNCFVSLPPVYAYQKWSLKRYVIGLSEVGAELSGTRRGIASLSHRHAYSS